MRRKFPWTNRFYEPGIDLDNLSVHRALSASSPAELPLRLHALAVLSGATPLDMVCTGGVHTGADMARALLCGAHVVQVASVLLERGPGHVAPLLADFSAWLDAKGYASSGDARAVLSLGRLPDPSVWTRLNYIQTLQTLPHPTTWRHPR